MVAFVGVMLALAGWQLLFALLLGKLASTSTTKLYSRMRTSVAPLLLSAPLLLAIYLSDQAFHSLSSMPIPRAIAVWTPILVSVAWQEAILLWGIRFPSFVLHRLSGGFAAPLLVFLSFASLYIFTAGGHLYSPDENGMFLVTRSLAERGSIAVPAEEAGQQTVTGSVASGNPEYRYIKYGLVPSLLAVPPYWVSKLLGLEPDPPSAAFPLPNMGYPLVAILVNPLVTAATCGLLYAFSRRLGFRAISSLVVVVAFGLGTPAWVYSKTFFSQPSAAFFLLGAAYFLLRGNSPSVWDCAISGLSLGLAAGSRAEVAILAVPILIPILRMARRETATAAGLLVAFGLGFALTGGVTLALYDYAKTGSVFATGHGDQGALSGFSREPWIGIYGSLYSSGFGFFIYNPVALPALFALPLLALRRPSVAWMIGTLVGVSVLFYGSFVDWFGGSTWANRYLVLILPFAVIPLATLVERPWRSPLAVVLVAGTVLLGASVNLLAVLFDFNNGWQELWSWRANMDLIMWDPHYSPILANLSLVKYFLFTGAKLDLYLLHKLGAAALLGSLLVTSGLATLAARAALHSETQDPAGRSATSSPSSLAALLD